jgi:hypothetical protein
VDREANFHSKTAFIDPINSVENEALSMAFNPMNKKRRTK